MKSGRKRLLWRQPWDQTFARGETLESLHQ